MNDEAPFLVGFEAGGIAVGGSCHRRVAFLFQIARSEPQLPQQGTQQPGADFLAAVLQSSTSRAVVKGGMATLALQFIEPLLDPTLPTEPSQPAVSSSPIIGANAPLSTPSRPSGSC
jgi:hypothetical protein